MLDDDTCEISFQMFREQWLLWSLPRGNIVVSSPTWLAAVATMATEKQWCLIEIMFIDTTTKFEAKILIVKNFDTAKKG